MTCRCWRGIHVLLTLAAVACCAWLLAKDRHWWYLDEQDQVQEPAPRLPPADDTLRSLLDIHSIRGTYRLPEGEHFGVIALLWFEDGKFQNRLAEWQMSSAFQDGCVVSYDITLGRGPNGKPQVLGSISEPTVSYRLKKSIPEEFFSKLDGEIFRQTPPYEEFRGYRVLAHLVSAKARPGGIERGGAFDVQRAVNNRETIAVIGTRTFKTRKEQDDWTAYPELPDP